MNIGGGMTGGAMQMGGRGGQYGLGLSIHLFVPKQVGCSKSRDGGDWETSFDHAGWSKCNRGNNYISGFRRSAQGAFWEDRIGRLEEARCCKASAFFLAQTCKNADWSSSFDQNNRWNSCPKNYYLHGLKKSNGDKLGNIEQAQCCKPVNSRYGKCYTQDITTSFDRKGWSTCKSGYSAVGLYRSGCDKLHCIEKIKCCQMAVSQDVARGGLGAQVSTNGGWGLGQTQVSHKGGWGLGQTQFSTNGGLGFGQSTQISTHGGLGFGQTTQISTHGGFGLGQAQVSTYGGLLVPKPVGCSKSRDGGDWGKSFDHAGWSKCNRGNNYISGFLRSAQGAFWEDRIGRLEEARCCKASTRFQGQTCKNADWSSSFDQNNRWNSCPKNYYLHGLQKSNGNGLHNIEQAQCCKPTNSQYGKCYTQDITTSFDRKGWSTCKSGYSAVGLYRSGCDKLHCIEKIKCCQIALTNKNMNMILH